MIKGICYTYAQDLLSLIIVAALDGDPGRLLGAPQALEV